MLSTGFADGTGMKSRRACREAALQVLYQCDILADFSDERVNFFSNHFSTQSDLEEDERPVAGESYSAALIQGVVKHIDYLDNMIGLASTNWSVSRMACIDRNIIRIATYEIHFSADVPPKVSLNEAIEIAKKFSADDSPKFINGVLDKIVSLKNESGALEK
jgi:N utilization substance protein B